MAVTRLPAVGIVRQVDELGRIVLPTEVRQRLGLDGAAMEFSVRGDAEIVLVRSGCAFCGTTEAPIAFCGRRVCRSCAARVAQALEAAAGGP